MRNDDVKINKSDAHLADVASFIFGKLFVAAAIGAVSNRVGLNGLLVGEIVTDVIYIFLLARAARVIKMRFSIDMLIIIFFFAISASLSLLLYPKNEDYLYSGIVNLLLYCIPGYMIFRSIVHIDEFLNRIRYEMYIIFGLGTVYFFGYSLRDNIRGIISYDMIFSYAYVVPVLFLIYYGMKRKSLIHYILALSGSIFILIQGSRGALLCIAAYFILNIWRGNIKLTRKILVLAVISVGSLMVWGNFAGIFQNFGSFLSRYNIRSRTVNSILYNSLSDSNGRDILANKSIEYINKNIFFGYGLFGDRTVLGSYPHNIFLELLLQFGLILGGIFILLIVYLVLKALISKNTDFYSRDLSIILISYSFVYKCLSGSYLSDPDFLIMLGFLINIANMKKQNEEKELQKIKGGMTQHEENSINTRYNNSL